MRAPDDFGVSPDVTTAQTTTQTGRTDDAPSNVSDLQASHHLNVHKKKAMQKDRERERERVSEGQSGRRCCRATSDTKQVM